MNNLTHIPSPTRWVGDPLPLKPGAVDERHGPIHTRQDEPFQKDDSPSPSSSPPSPPPPPPR